MFKGFQLTESLQSYHHQKVIGLDDVPLPISQSDLCASHKYRLGQNKLPYPCPQFGSNAIFGRNSAFLRTSISLGMTLRSRADLVCYRVLVI